VIINIQKFISASLGQQMEKPSHAMHCSRSPTLKFFQFIHMDKNVIWTLYTQLTIFNVHEDTMGFKLSTSAVISTGPTGRYTELLTHWILTSCQSCCHGNFLILDWNDSNHARAQFNKMDREAGWPESHFQTPSLWLHTCSKIFESGCGVKPYFWMTKFLTSHYIRMRRVLFWKN